MSNHNLQEIARAAAEVFRETDPVLVRSIFRLMRWRRSWTQGSSRARSAPVPTA